MRKEKFDKIVTKKNKSEQEIKMLDPYCVKRAILMAAGLGTRMRPITNILPKPMVKINGKRIIETIIDALLLNEITDIYIVRGYMQQSFDSLLKKYPNLHFINNFSYAEGNNILSAHLAGNLICQAFVMPADIYVNNPKIFNKYQWSSNVLGYKIDKTDDWCIETDGSIIKRLSPGGKGENCYKDTGIFYWNEIDGNRLYKDIASVCSNKANYQRYWSNVPFELYKNSYNIYVRECKENDVIEIDTYDELCILDSSYRQIKEEACTEIGHIIQQKTPLTKYGLQEDNFGEELY